MADIFADTSGWGHLVDKSQPYHLQAASLYRSHRNNGGRIITTNYIVNELVSLMTSPLRIPRSAIISFVESIKSSPFIEVVHIHEILDQSAWQILKQYSDKEWSLTDCASFALMKQYGISNAFASDHHFEQFGFRLMLK